MNTNHLIGLILLVVGSVLLYLGLTATDSFGESVKHGITGNYTNKTTWYIVVGGAAGVSGLFMFLRSGRPRTN